MRRLQAFYGKIGKGLEAIEKPFETPSLLKDYHPLIVQTPGRHKYYSLTNWALLPENLKWEIRLPTKIAGSEPPRRFHNEVEQ